MNKKDARNLRLTLECGIPIAVIIALIQGKDAIAKSAIVVLCVLGATALIGAGYELGWLRAPIPVGTPVRAVLLVAAIICAMAALGYWAWPKQTVVTPHALTRAASIAVTTRAIAPLTLGKHIQVNSVFGNLSSDMPAYNVIHSDATGIVETEKLGINGEMMVSEQKEDQLFSSLFAQWASNHPCTGGIEIAPHQTLFTSSFGPVLDRANLKAIRTGTKAIFHGEVFTWSDSVGNHTSESCSWLQPYLPHSVPVEIWHECAHHNGISVQQLCR